ncbi:MAG: (2Fe-2S)-binding protein [Pseudomonadales bacterium]|jgi:bacterioferritin-associated ferredoxin|uniref:(2Fe-2S)-binding protein n=1 Tax=unclassified Ketobacter TaxID=2639109 RepID=UPI000C617930|nr:MULTISPECIES: (2Fe-2S)-binding protein [unclassified Ketobacter]MAQ24345.1 (2Fe-2S)-binding protein [Pseudomonadales bacterium]MEC8813723.1 (2Fe-2S)-binding protein [Pseudomonadota bacterium]TNC88291.1 MAG: (2Fe-2S)-binding protein [Alcanivorax sp.]HAG94641.1 (2Fe-2S)-binding protein [Gammaproteobacteria bacterium]MBI25567.1 (2Fe-2S)-binding protein [Pseudomonadales bacterium]
MYICLCKDVTDRQLRESIRRGACSFGQVRRHCNLGGKCGKCMGEARLIVQKELMNQGQTSTSACGNR